jgi:hypothetical protein
MDNIQRLFIDCHKSCSPDNYNEYYYKEENNVKPEILGSKYMSKRVFGYIKNKLHYKIEKEYIFDNTRVAVTIYSVNKSFNFAELYRVLNYYIYTLNTLSHKPVLQLVFYLTNLKKLFPSTKDVILNEDNINSGVTFFNQDQRLIGIYRKEEIYKVLLHELIHFYGLDFHHYDPGYDQYFIEKYKIQLKQPPMNRRNPLALYESYTDAVSCYGYLLTHMLFKGQDMTPEAIEANLNKEKKHFHLQAAKVFKFGGMKEATHAFSYYIVKDAIYRNFPKFLEFVDTHGIALDSVRKQEDYLKLIIGFLDDNDYWKSLKKTRTRTIFLSSLKMTKLKW